MRNVLIAGGCGFIGSQVAAAFRESGDRIRIVDSLLFEPSPVYVRLAESSGIENTRVDIANRQQLRKALGARPCFDVVINCAGPARPLYFFRNPLTTIRSLVWGTWNLAELAAECSAVFVHASSSEVYGVSSKHPLAESALTAGNPLSLRACYAEGKRGSETIIEAFAREKQLKAVVLRLFNIYGPGFSPDDDRLVPNLVKALRQKGTVVVDGDGKQSRSFCYVDDAVRAFTMAVDAAKPKVTCVNIGNPDSMSVNELVNRFQSLAGCKIHVMHGAPRVDEVLFRQPNIDLAMEVFGWQPAINIEDGLRLTLRAQLGGF